MYIKVNEVKSLADQLLSGAITRFGFVNKLKALPQHTPESIAQEQWRDATTDPPAESGKYQIARYWDDIGTWYVTDTNYSKVHNQWNCFDSFSEDQADGSYTVDYWMPLPEPPKTKS